MLKLNKKKAYFDKEEKKKVRKSGLEKKIAEINKKILIDLKKF